jgi:amidase
MWSILGAPQLNVPGFEGDNGMPIGLSLVGPRYRDQHVIAAAKALGPVFEKGGGWKRKNF